MKITFPFIGGLILAGAIGTVATGQDSIDRTAAKAINARQSHMQLNSFNLGLLGGMAKGEIDYDAEAASGAAANLAALARMDESRYWLPGTDVETLGKDQTEALVKIWADDSKFDDRMKDLASATAAMADAAGNGLDALRGAMGPVGKACGGCHEDYRLADD